MQIVLMIIGGLIGLVTGNLIRKKLKLKYKPFYPNGLISFVTGVALPVAIGLGTIILLLNFRVSTQVGNVIWSTVKGMNFGIVFGIFFF